MRLIFMIDHMNGYGGAQRVLANLMNEAVTRKDDVLLVLTGGTITSVYSLHSSIQVFKSEEKNKVKKVRDIRKRIKEYNPNCVISFLTLVNILALISTLGLNVPVIISERNDPDKETKLEKISSFLFYRFADTVVVQTEDIAKKIGKIFHGEIRIIANPINGHDFEKNSYDSGKNIIAVGRLNHQKNYHFMLRCFKQFLCNNPGYKLDIFGVGDLLDDLRSFSEELGIDDSVAFRGNVNNILEREIKYDMFIMTSDFEGMPNALAEAMSVGLPCVSIDCDGGGAKELLSTDKGILVDKGDIDGFVSAMEKITHDRNYAQKIGRKAKEIKVELSVPNIMKKWYQAINSL